ncbi:NAD(P)H-dependent flavin oxidoreductase [Volucribacter amazonae]|uniref:Enoyl-[acyl-carrier protein] reductase II n=1 Tax=Volucribacter amazonae TaxID=256731 RepID=A0A9X4PPT2_9PAST|nr:nitronate monooxygenase [Volucribacter amazonae]MDG6895358.1 hypothetical protein [Volucribacter amazonae]
MINPICQILGIQYPIIQAPMNWLTDARFVAAVAEAGGLGVLGPNAGDKDPALDSAGQLRREIRRIHQLTQKPTGLNIYSPAAEDKANLDYALRNIGLAFEEGMRIFALVGEPNEALFSAIKAQQGRIIFRALTPTVANAQQAEQMGADILVATGIDEGGWIPRNQIGTFSIVPTIVDSVRIPVLAAGGINDIRGVRAAFALGASGVYVGTGFLTTIESPTAENVKQLIIQSRAEALQFVTPIQRSIPTPFAKQLAQRYQQGEDEASLTAETELRWAMREGKLDKGIISVNTAIDLIKQKQSVADVIHQLMADFKQE